MCYSFCSIAYQLRFSRVFRERTLNVNEHLKISASVALQLAPYVWSVRITCHTSQSRRLAFPGTVVSDCNKRRRRNQCGLYAVARKNRGVGCLRTTRLCCMHAGSCVSGGNFGGGYSQALLTGDWRISVHARNNAYVRAFFVFVKHKKTKGLCCCSCVTYSSSSAN